MRESTASLSLFGLIAIIALVALAIKLLSSPDWRRNLLIVVGVGLFGLFLVNRVYVGRQVPVEVYDSSMASKFDGSSETMHAQSSAGRTPQSAFTPEVAVAGRALVGVGLLGLIVAIGVTIGAWVMRASGPQRTTRILVVAIPAAMLLFFVFASFAFYSGFSVESAPEARTDSLSWRAEVHDEVATQPPRIEIGESSDDGEKSAMFVAPADGQTSSATPSPPEPAEKPLKTDQADANAAAKDVEAVVVDSSKAATKAPTSVDWTDRPAEILPDGTFRIQVSAGPRADAMSCQAELYREIDATVEEYVRQSLYSGGYAGGRGIRVPRTTIEQRILAGPPTIETRTYSVGPMIHMHATLLFTPEVQRLLHQMESDRNFEFHAALTGMLATIGLTLLAGAYAFLKFAGTDYGRWYWKPLASAAALGAAAFVEAAIWLEASRTLYSML
jgi:hypothetical protein